MITATVMTPLRWPLREKDFQAVSEGASNPALVADESTCNRWPTDLSKLKA